LKDIIRRLEMDFSCKGEVICEIHVNGILLNESDETRFGSSPAHEIHDLSVRTNRPDALIMQALESARVYIPQLEESCFESAGAFRGHDLAMAQRCFSETLEGCTWLVETLTHIRGAASGIGQPIGSIDRWFEAEKAINRVVREVSEGYIASDFVLVADLLEYELTGALQIWAEALNEEASRRA
jgi:hypothetical protein